MKAGTPFLAIFPGCADLADAAGGLEKAYVTDVQIDSDERSMTVCARFARMPSLIDIGALSERLNAEYALSSCSLIPD